MYDRVICLVQTLRENFHTVDMPYIHTCTTIQASTMEHVETVVVRIIHRERPHYCNILAHLRLDYYVLQKGKAKMPEHENVKMGNIESETNSSTLSVDSEFYVPIMRTLRVEKGLGNREHKTLTT